MKIAIDVPAEPSGLDALGKLGQIEIERFEWPEVEAPSRVLDPVRIRDADLSALDSQGLPADVRAILGRALAREPPKNDFLYMG